MTYGKILCSLIFIAAVVFATAQGGYANLGSGSPEEVREALEAGADPNAPDDQGWLPLVDALFLASQQDFEVAQLLLDAGADPNAILPDGRPLIVLAATVFTDPAALAFLIEAGADVNARGPLGETALINASWYDMDIEKVRILLEAGADPNARTMRGETALITAATYNHNPEATRLLLEAGSNPNARDDTGWTPLLYAAFLNENPEVVRLLLDHGADPTLQDPILGRYPADFAEDNENLRNSQVFWILHDARYEKP